MIFGMSMIVWSVWVGIVLLRRKPAGATRQVETLVPLSGTATLSR
jgi:hypothetical protein